MASGWSDLVGIIPAASASRMTTAADLSGLAGLGWQSRDTARLVPAFARGLDLITGIAAGMPLVDLDPTSGRRISPRSLTTGTLDPDEPTTVTIRRTVDDLVCHGKAYWLVTSVDGLGHPRTVQHLSPDRVQSHYVSLGDMAWHTPYPGHTHRRAWEIIGHAPACRGCIGDPAATDSHRYTDLVIEFDAGTPGALASGWHAIRTALALDAAARNYAESPLPQIALKNLGIDLDQAEIEEVLTAWEAARAKRGTAYLNTATEVQTFGWSAGELQLVEARQHAALEVARILNLDPVWVGASTPGASLTYQNRQDLNQSLLDMTIMPILRVIEQRLSMADVTGGGRLIRFDTSAFLRANLGERVSALTAYVASGVLTAQEARAIEPIVPEGDIPA
jgi:hypothetical protein